MTNPSSVVLSTVIAIRREGDGRRVAIFIDDGPDQVLYRADAAGGPLTPVTKESYPSPTVRVPVSHLLLAADGESWGDVVAGWGRLESRSGMSCRRSEAPSVQFPVREITWTSAVQSAMIFPIGNA